MSEGMGNITDLKVGLGADLTQLDSDLEKAKNMIAAIGSEETSTIKVSATPKVDAKEFVSKIREAVGLQKVKVSVTPDVNAKQFISQVQKAIKSETVKVRVDSGRVSATKLGDEIASVGGPKPTSGTGTVPVKVDLSEATEKLDFFEKRVEQIKKVGNVDISVQIKTDSMGEVTRGVITYTDALGNAQSETYALKNVIDGTGQATQAFQYIGENLSESTTKAARFKEGLAAVGNTLDSFLSKNLDIADEIGADKLVADFKALQSSTNAEVVAIQKFRNELNAAKNEASAIREVQKVQENERKAALQQQTAEERQRRAEEKAALQAQAAAERQKNAEARAASQARAAEERQRRAEERAALQDQMAFEQAINQLRNVYISDYRQKQEQITSIYKKQKEYVDRRIAAERSMGSQSSKRVAAALSLQQATLKTSTYTARLATYAKDVARQIDIARKNMSGLQGYSRSTANIFKGIVLSQSFYKAVGLLRSIVSEAWELSVALNTAEATFSGMLKGGQQQAKELLNVLKQEAITTPFEIGNLLEAARILTAYGIEAENIMFVMRGVEQATAAIGDPAKMKTIASALGQIQTYGKVTGRVIERLQRAGIAAGQILKEELGLPDTLNKSWSDLEIDATTAINALVHGMEKRYGSAMANMALTTQQKLNNMRESFTLVFSGITDPIRRGIDSIIDYITPKIQELYQAIQAVGLGNALKTLIPAGLYNAVVGIIDRLVGAFQALRIVLSQLRPVIDAVLGALAWYGRTIYNIFITIISVLGMFGKVLGSAVGGALTLETVLKRLLGLKLVIKGMSLLIVAVQRVWSVVSVVFRGITLLAKGVAIYMKGLAAVMSAAGLAGAAGFLPVIGVLLVIIGLVAALAGALDSVKAAGKRVGEALKNIGGGTKIGEMFEDMSGGIQDEVEAYNEEVAEQNKKLSNELSGDSKDRVDESKDQSGSAKGAADATEKAMKGLMSFDEIYKINEPEAGGAGGAGGAGVGDLGGLEALEEPLAGVSGILDGFGGTDWDIFEDMDLDELQDALGDLWSALRPLLDDVLLYALKMLLYFKEMHLRSQLMTGESKEQLLSEKAQTSEDKEQLLQEKTQTSEDKEQLLQEKTQTSEDKEQLLQEKAQTSQDKEQLLQEKAQTSQDKEQLLQEKAQTSQDKEQLLQEKAQTTEDKEQLINEKLQTVEDREQLINEKLQTAEDKEQLINEKLQTVEDKEQLINEKLQTTEDKEQLINEKLQTTESKERSLGETGRGGTGATGSKGTAAALALINVAQIGASAKLLVDDIQTLREGGATLSDWMSLFVNGLMMAVDVLQLFGAIKLITGGLGKAAAKGAGKAAAAGAGKAAAKGAEVAGDSVTGTVEALDTTTGKMSPKLKSLAKNLAMGLVIIAEVAAAAILIAGAIWALGKILEQVGIAWQPVLDNGDTILAAMGIGTGILAAVGVVTAALGSVGKDLIIKMALGVAILAEIGVATGLFLAEIWAIGWALDQIAQAWQPVLDNGDTVKTAIAVGTGILAAVGIVTGVLGTVGAGLMVNIALGTLMLLEIGVAAGLFLAEIWAIGWALDQIAQAWQPVLDNGDTVETAIAVGTGLLIAIGAVAALLGVAAVATGGLIYVAIAAGTAMLLEIGIAAVLFIEELRIVGDRLVELGKAWQPVLDNGETIAAGIEMGTSLLTAIGTVAAALGVAAVASVGLLPLAISLGTKMLVSLSESFIDFTDSLIDVANKLGNDLAPALRSASEKLPDLASDMEDFTNFMTYFAEQVVKYTKATAIAGLAGTIDTIIGWFTKDPLEKFAKDVSKIGKQASKLGDELKVANPELEAAHELLADYQTFMDLISNLMNSSSNTSLSSEMFINLEEVGKNLITGFAAGIKNNARDAVSAIETLFNDVLDKAQNINGTSGGESTVYRAEGSRIILGFSKGVQTGQFIAESAVESLFNGLLRITQTINKSTGANSGTYLAEGAKLIDSFVSSIKSGRSTANTAATALFEGVLSIAQTINKSSGRESVTYKKEGEKMASGLATGIDSKSFQANNAFKKMLNGMLTTMDIFTGKITTAINNILSKTARTMSNLSVNQNTGNVSYTPVRNEKITRIADGGIIKRDERNARLVKKPTMLASNIEAGEAGAEVVVPLENSRFIRSFADDIARAVTDTVTQQPTRNLRVQVDQARAGSAQSINLSTASASEISDSMRSWFTPLMQSLHDALEQDRVVDVMVPNTSNALWREVLSELKAVNSSSGSRGLSVVR